MKLRTRLTCVCALLLFSFLLNIQVASSESPDKRLVRIAELKIYPDRLNAYKAALEEEISASIQTEPGVLTLYAVSVKGHPEDIRLFEMYRDVASYQSHLQTPHFKKYKEHPTHGKVAESS